MMSMQSSVMRTSSRRGISLVEVLISMFVLAIGLMGVAALIPAGRHEIVEGMKLENSSMVGRSAFRDLQVRGYLNPVKWRQSPTSNQILYQPTSNPTIPFVVLRPNGTPTNSLQAAYCIDPLGRTASPANFPIAFPANATDNTVAPLLRVVPFKPVTAVPAESRATFDSIFRCSFDLIADPNTTNKDLPPTQKYFPDGGGLPVRRASTGNYSWIATVVSDPTKPAADAQVTVSVAVFYKRDLSAAGAGEHAAQVRSFPVVPMTSGGEVVIENLPTDPAGNVKPLKPGQWIMLAGTSLAPASLNNYRWYRVLSAANYDTGASEQRVTLAGQDWSIPTSPTNTIPVKAWIFDNIVSVYEKNMPLEIE